MATTSTRPRAASPIVSGRSTHVGDSEKDRDAAAAAGVGTFVWARDFFGWDPRGPRAASRLPSGA